MSSDLTIDFEWERLGEGPPQERSCFGMLQIALGDIQLAEGQDGFVERLRRGPLVSGYHFAEWLAWNWWRLTRESRADNPPQDWYFAHCLGTVGSGYLWPNITIYTDRERTLLVAKPTHPQGFSAFRFTADWTAAVPRATFESALDSLMAQIQGKLRADGIAQTNFDRIWDEVVAERTDPEAAAYRELEATLGYDPGEGDPAEVRSRLDDATRLGRDAIIELSAAHRPGLPPATTAQIIAWAHELGSEVRPQDAAGVAGLDLGPRGNTPPWLQGYKAARALRQQHNLAAEPLADDLLAELCGTSPKLLQPSQSAPLTFGLDASLESGRIVLRSNFKTGRRFDLARILGDRIASGLAEPMIPVTGSHTYRQQLQRAFAAELLCPYDALEAFLAGDYSEPARDDAAQYFKVSERTVTTLLVNHKQLYRGVLDESGDIAEQAA